MPMIDLSALARKSKPVISLHTLAAIVSVEYEFDPYAIIGVVDGYSSRQSSTRDDALSTEQSFSA